MDNLSSTMQTYLYSALAIMGFMMLVIIVLMLWVKSLYEENHSLHAEIDRVQKSLDAAHEVGNRRIRPRRALEETESEMVSLHT